MSTAKQLRKLLIPLTHSKGNVSFGVQLISVSVENISEDSHDEIEIHVALRRSLRQLVRKAASTEY